MQLERTAVHRSFFIFAEKGFSQSDYSMLHRYCVERKRNGVIAKCSEVKRGFSWKKFAFSYY